MSATARVAKEKHKIWDPARSAYSTLELIEVVNMNCAFWLWFRGAYANNNCMFVTYEI